MRTLLTSLLVFVAFFAAAQQQSTTFLLVRHAEKMADGGKDPQLSPDGNARAERLATMLASQKVDAILSTNFIRTKSTVQPLSTKLGVAIDVYEKLDRAAVDELIRKHRGGTIVVCGHSNTIPALANLLLGSSQLKDFADTEYDNFLVIELVEAGKGKLLHLKY